MAIVALTLSCAKAGASDRAPAGIERLGNEELRELLDQARWHDPPGWRVLGGIRLTEDFEGDLATDAELPLPGELLDQVGREERLVLLLRLPTEEEMPESFRRLTLANLGRLGGDGVLTLASTRVKTLLPKETQTGRAAELGQAGPFVLVEHWERLALLTGTTRVVIAGRSVDDSAHYGPAFVSASSSPFVAKASHVDGRFLLPVERGVSTVAAAYLPSKVAIARAPAVASAYVPRLGDPEALSEALAEREAVLDEERKNTASTTFEWLSRKPEDLLGAPLVEVNLYFAQAPEEHVEPPEQDPDAAPVMPPPPGDDLGPQPDPLPPEGAPVARSEPGREKDAPQIDLGCTGVSSERKATLSTNGAVIGKDLAIGWIGMGDVRITRERFAEIFGEIAPLRAESGYFDDYEGYCLLSTGNGRYARSVANEAEALQLRPGPAGSGKLSEIWQRVQIPAKESGFRSLEMRLAVFTEETGFAKGPLGDGFFVKFDEEPDFVAVLSLETIADELTDLPQGLSGVMWDIERSSEALGDCEEEGPARCHAGYVPPRVLCHELTEGQLGQTMTLRIALFDGADPFGDTALAIDSIIFSKDGCSKTFTGEPKLP